MWEATIPIVMIAVGAAIFEVPRLRKKKYKKEIWFFSILLILATLANIIEVLD